MRPFLNPANPSPRKRTSIITQVGSSGMGSALLAGEAEAGVELSESGGGGKAPRSRLASPEFDAGWRMAPAEAACVARASIPPSAKEKPTVQSMMCARMDPRVEKRALGNSGSGVSNLT